MDEKELKEMCDVRTRDYGDPRISFEGLGMMWTAILETHYQLKLPWPIPAHVAALFMGALKISRASKGFKEDNYDDLRNFIMFALDFHKTDVLEDRCREAIVKAMDDCRANEVCQNGK